MMLEDARHTAIAAAYHGARQLRRHFGNLSGVTKKGAIDLVTEADTASEAAILEIIRAAFPDHGVLAEESGAAPSPSPYRWIVDPLDGTTNFAHGLAQFAVSIALERAGEILVGIVLNPVTGELFSALQGQGAFLNGRPIRVSATARVDDGLLVTGFPYDVRERPEPIVARLAACLKASRGVRRLGAAALDLCFVACGRFDGFWEEALKPWDTAAGVLIAREAGSRVTTFANAAYAIDDPTILATNGRIHDEMIHLLTKGEQ